MAPIAHLDIDAFYASVELLRRPELRGLPVIVSGSGPRAVVTTASYEARKFGIGSAMPTARARRLCPDAIVVAPDFAAYREASRKVMELVRAQVERVEVVGLDEAYLDLDGLVSPRAAMRRLVEEIRAETGLDCSVGIGPNRLVAKVASDAEKPRGFVVLTREQACARFAAHPPGLVPGHRPEDRRAAASAWASRRSPRSPRRRRSALVAQFGANHGPDLQRRGALRGLGGADAGARSPCPSRARRRSTPTSPTRRGWRRSSPSSPRSSASASRRRSAAGAPSRSRCASTTSRRSRARARSARVDERRRAVVAGVALELLREYAPARPVRLLGVRVAGVRDAARSRRRRPTSSRCRCSVVCMPTLDVDETDLYYERRGAGEPLLLIQGMSGHSLHWGEPFLAALERDFELVLYDHRGVGRSAPARGPFTIADLAADADRAARRARDRARARPRDLDGRDGRPGARARRTRARAHADARRTYAAATGRR